MATVVLSSVVQTNAGQITAATSERCVILDDSKEWYISHSGLAPDNATSSPAKVFFSIGTDGTTDVIPVLTSNPLQVRSGLWYVETGVTIRLRAGIRFLHFKTTGGVPVLRISPSSYVSGYAKG